MDTWVSRLKAAYDAGYYRTEPAVGAQAAFPWQNKSCKDCPFWSNNICQVFSAYRAPLSHTCSYFDPWNREQAEGIIHRRQWQRLRRWWDWFNDRGAPR